VSCLSRAQCEHGGGWDLTDEDLKFVFYFSDRAQTFANGHCRHVIQLYKSIDGNFRLQKKKKNDDPDDVALMEGLGYFPPDPEYQEYLKRVGESKEVSDIVRHWLLIDVLL
jgi:hypothetical protein